MAYTDEQRIRAKRRALYILGSRDHSKKELYDKLRRNYPDDLCRYVVKLMEDNELINEEQYAKRLYAAYFGKGYGKIRIRSELRRRGLPDDIIAENEQEYNSEDFVEEIIQLVNKKYSSKLDFSDRKSVDRVAAALARRGYGWDDIKLALSRVKNGEFDEG